MRPKSIFYYAPAKTVKRIDETTAKLKTIYLMKTHCRCRPRFYNVSPRVPEREFGRVCTARVNAKTLFLQIREKQRPVKAQRNVSYEFKLILKRNVRLLNYMYTVILL